MRLIAEAADKEVKAGEESRKNNKSKATSGRRKGGAEAEHETTEGPKQKSRPKRKRIDSTEVEENASHSSGGGGLGPDESGASIETRRSGRPRVASRRAQGM